MLYFFSTKYYCQNSISFPSLHLACHSFSQFGDYASFCFNFQIEINATEEENAKSALKAINALVDSIMTEDLVAPPDGFDLVIGNKGSVARGLEKDLEVKLDYIRTEDDEPSLIRVSCCLHSFFCPCTFWSPNKPLNRGQSEKR
jgi:hypothetical protein